MQDAMILWDGLFACDPTLEIAQWICVAMLMRIRNQCKIFFVVYLLNFNIYFLLYVSDTL